MKQHIDTITDLLLGAAYADKRLESKERDAITGMLSKLLGVSDLPDAQRERIKGFNPAKLDVAAAAGSLVSLADSDKHKILELVASVTESDDEIDLAEDAYLRKVAVGLGIPESEIEALTIELIEDDDLDQFFEDDAPSIGS